ncbi:histidinol-phosphate transaminase [Alteromonas sp. KUL49]|uniref:histidinol-phosphate transaminase n=1 Tax=Alteromonas sp. KUL49 TaxID=2480798 RepID=UPI00102F14A8|nr:histidinol-phosphate transaminase [Alteromonas sp. KUL49]TAP35514.1 histidinol-phosphate transaminase [Alteromonas sp. KUL49]GEA13393.1 histidinol-phosphate aminotransferase [Alteromonas sp. KUL49]
MSTLIDTLINDNLVPLKPYESARRLFSGGQDWLNANESPFANDYGVDSSSFNRYPSCQPKSVVNGYASYANVTKEQLIVTRGADEGIELLIRTFCTPGKDNILICPPTYGMYAISAETCDIGVKTVPLKSDFNLDVEGICATDNVNLVFICAPNNPTGTQVARADIKTVLEHFSESALVVVDEAYIEFDADNTWATEINNYPNLVVLRTLSKAFALAGLRCGFTLAQAPVIQALLKVIAPYPIPEPVAQIAAQALSSDALERLQQQVSELNQEKAALAAALAAVDGITLVGDTKANFILFRFAKASALMAYLVSQGMLIRDQSKQLNLSNCLRVSIGTKAQNQRLMNLINAFLQEDAA